MRKKTVKDTGDGGDDGNDDNPDNDDEADDLDDDEDLTKEKSTEVQMSESSNLKTPASKSGTNTGHKTVATEVADCETIDQEAQLALLMKGIPSKLVTAVGIEEQKNPIHIDVDLGSEAILHGGPEPEFLSHLDKVVTDVREFEDPGVSISVVIPNSDGKQLTVDQVLPISGTSASSSSISEVVEFGTPEPTLSEIPSDCKIVGNKWQSLLEDESQHSKWEEFRRMAKVGSSHEECSQLLLKMELQDSDEETEDQDQKMVTLEDVNLGDSDILDLAALYEEKQDRKKQKRDSVGPYSKDAEA